MLTNLWGREQKFVRVINAMESRGILIDQEMCRREIAIGTSRMNTILQELDGRKPTSNKDLHQMLIVELGLPVVKISRKTGKPSFDKMAMAEYDMMLSNRNSNLAKRILEYRGWQSAVSSNYSSYLSHVSADGRLRPNFWIHGTETSRLSCREPNTQNIPKSGTKPWNGRMKEVFIAKDMFELPNVDYSQVEFRLAAAYAKEDVLLDAFNTPGRNVFREMSEALGRDYNQCKTFTYATLYGAQAQKIGQILGLEESDAQKFGDDWRHRYSKVVELSEKVNGLAARRGYIKLWTGRRRHFPNRRDSRKAFNSLLQGGGAEVVKSAMIRIKDRVEPRLPYQMLLQVHDSLVGEGMISEREEILSAVQHEMSLVAEEKDFGVAFTTEADFWGPKVHGN